MTGLHLPKLAGNAGWSIVVQGIRAAALAVVMVLLARYLGPQEFGVFATAFSIVKIASVLAGLGLERVAVRQIVQDRVPEQIVVRRALWLRLLAGGVALSLAVGVGALIDLSIPGVLPLVAIMGLGLLLQAAFAFDAAFQAGSQLRLTALATAPPLILASILKIAAISSGASLLTFAWLELLEGCLLAAGLGLTYWATRRRKSTTSERAATPRTPQLLRAGLPMMLAALAVIAYMRADIVMLALLVDTRAVGLYTAAAQLSELWTLLPVALMPAILPSLLALRLKSEPRYHELLARLFAVASLTGWIIALAVFLLAPFLVSLIFGRNYESASGILRVHIWSLPFIYISVVQAAWDLSENKLWLSFMRTSTGAVLNIVLNLWWIPAFGAVGAACATLVSYSCVGIFLNAVSKETRSLFMVQLRALLLVPFLLAEWRKRGSYAERGLGG